MTLIVIFLVITAYLDAKHQAVPLWLLLIDGVLLICQSHDLTRLWAGALVLLVVCTKRIRKAIGSADLILIPSLVTVFAMWPIIGFAFGQYVAKKAGKSKYPLIPWLVAFSLLGFGFRCLVR